MTTEAPIREGQVLTGPLFNEPMRVETIRASGTGRWEAGLVGQQSEQFRRVVLGSDDFSGLTIADAAPSYNGDGRLLRIGLQAYALGIAYEFDPYFGLSTSRVDPLPHQLEAVYEYLLKLPSVRFLLADDAGAGKTIMAGLLVRELKLRDRADHVLLLTATPHKGDPQNFTLFLQLLDQDAYADVRSIRTAMERQRAPFYLRRTKEAMVYPGTPGERDVGRQASVHQTHSAYRRLCHRRPRVRSV